MTTEKPSERAMRMTSKEWATKVELPPATRMTSVNAHTATVIVVSMSVIEMEKLIETFGVANVNLEESDRILQREFADAVRSLR